MSNPFIPLINSYFHEPEASLLNGILFGVRSDMSDTFYQALLNTGTVHVIALSGQNISILITLIGKLTMIAGRKTSIIITIMFIVMFVLFVGPSVSVVRAAIMGSMTLVALYFGRQDWSLLSLFLTIGVMLLYDRTLIANVSFQLSCTATLGIILAGGQTQCQQKKKATDQAILFLRENMKITLSAQLFTLPIILYHFNRISLIAPLVNLFIGWVVQPIMILGMIVSILGLVWWPLGIIPSWFVWVLLKYFVTVIYSMSIIPGAGMDF